MYQKTILILLEGFGVNNKKFGNTINSSNMQNFRKIMEEYPNTVLKTDLNKGSENTLSSPFYGILNIARCKKTPTYISKLNEMIENGDFFSNAALQNLFKKIEKNEGVLHLVGMISDGQIETGIRHIKAFLEAAKRKDIHVYLHLIADGMDSNQRKILEYIDELEKIMEEKNIGKIASIQGRDYALNKTEKWDKTQKAYEAIYYGKGKKILDDKFAMGAEIEEQYMQGKLDNQIEPIVVYNGDKYVGKINDGDGVIFFNIIKERMVQLQEAFINPYFDHFETSSATNEILTSVKSENIPKENQYIIEDENNINLFNEILKNNISVKLIYDKVRKYEMENVLILGEDRKKVSKTIVNNLEYNEYVSNITKSISNITKEVIKNMYEKENNLNEEGMQENKQEIIVADYPQLDILAHSGKVFELEIALKKIDEEIPKIYEAAIKNNCRIIITSTHGNAEEMLEEKTGEILTRNTKNMLPFIYINEMDKKRLNHGSIYNIGPTILKILNIKVDKEKIAESLII